MKTEHQYSYNDLIRDYTEYRKRRRALADELDGIKDQLRYWEKRRRHVEETIERVSGFKLSDELPH